MLFSLCLFSALYLALISGTVRGELRAERVEITATGKVTADIHTPSLIIREGASIPVVAFFVDEMKMPVVLLGFGLPDDNLHAPNEKLTLTPWYMGIEAFIHFFHNLVA